MSAKEGKRLRRYQEYCGARQDFTPTWVNYTTIRLYNSMAIGAVRSTARRLHPGGSSKPRCWLLPWLVSSPPEPDLYGSGVEAYRAMSASATRFIARRR